MENRKVTIKTAPCPNCGTVGSRRRIYWGLPAQAIDLEKCEIGGCCIPENPPELACSECPWPGHRSHLIPTPRNHQ